MTGAPRWVNRRLVEAVHFGQLQEHGGLPGVRNENALEAALARAQHKHAYEPDTELAELAAAYAFALATAHAFNDANKRTAFLTMTVFLGLNGWAIDCSEESVVTLMIGIAVGTMGEADIAAWIRERMVPDLG